MGVSTEGTVTKAEAGGLTYEAMTPAAELAIKTARWCWSRSRASKRKPRPAGRIVGARGRADL
jgi:hypothetical protein